MPTVRKVPPREAGFAFLSGTGVTGAADKGKSGTLTVRFASCPGAVTVMGPPSCGPARLPRRHDRRRRRGPSRRSRRDSPASPSRVTSRSSMMRTLFGTRIVMELQVRRERPALVARALHPFGATGAVGILRRLRVRDPRRREAIALLRSKARDSWQRARAGIEPLTLRRTSGMPRRIAHSPSGVVLRRTSPAQSARSCRRRAPTLRP